MSIIDKHISTTDLSDAITNVKFAALKRLHETLTTTTFDVDVDRHFLPT